jgi:hypothetical protein
MKTNCIFLIKGWSNDQYSNVKVTRAGVYLFIYFFFSIIDLIRILKKVWFDEGEIVQKKG